MADGDISILIHQEPLLGELPDEKQIADFMKLCGFIPLSGKRVEGVSKKFCRSLKKSLWYGEPTESVVAGHE